jgi:hypothetical protein
MGGDVAQGKRQLGVRYRPGGNPGSFWLLHAPTGES